MLRHMFLFGVLLPTVGCVVVFIGFLVCWFKLGIREHFFKKHLLKGRFKKALPQHAPEQVAGGAEAYHHITSGLGDLGGGASGNPEDPESGGRRGGKNVLRGGGSGGGTGSGTPGMGRSSSFEQAMEQTDSYSQYSIEDPAAALCQPGTDTDPPHFSSYHFTNPHCDTDMHTDVDQHADADTDPTITLPENSTSNFYVKSFRNGSMETGIFRPISGAELVQQTFHFPIPDPNGVSFEHQDDSDAHDDSNYGHFVPRSHVESDPYLRDKILGFDTESVDSEDAQLPLKVDLHCPLIDTQHHLQGKVNLGRPQVLPPVQHKDKMDSLMSVSNPHARLQPLSCATSVCSASIEPAYLSAHCNTHSRIVTGV